MCEMAIDVVNKQKDDNIKLVHEMFDNTYTKDKVDELLLKQREMCADKASVVYYEMFNDYVIDNDSIINAKLEY